MPRRGNSYSLQGLLGCVLVLLVLGSCFRSAPSPKNAFSPSRAKESEKPVAAAARSNADLAEAVGEAKKMIERDTGADVGDAVGRALMADFRVVSYEMRGNRAYVKLERPQGKGSWRFAHIMEKTLKERGFQDPLVESVPVRK